jgi:hypothetical protein
MAQRPSSPVAPAEHLTHKQVVQTCTRLLKHNHHRQLYEFCRLEPRGRQWTLSRIAQLGPPQLLDVKVRELRQRLMILEAAQPSSPPAPASPSLPQPAQLEPEEEVDLRSIEFRSSEKTIDLDAGNIAYELSSESSGSAYALPDAFAHARARGDAAAAGRVLLAHMKTQPPAGPVPLQPAEFRDLAHKLAAAGQLRIVMELWAVLPKRTTASALLDVARAAKVGSRTTQACLEYHRALKNLAADDAEGRARLDHVLLASVKSLVKD